MFNSNPKGEVVLAFFSPAMRAILAVLCLYLPLFPFENGDIQSWNDISFRLQRSKLTCFISEQGKWGGNISDFFSHRADMGLRYKVGQSAELSLNFKQVHNKEGGMWQKNAVPYGGLFWEFLPDWAEIQNRQLLELWIMEGTTQYVRYRNRMKIYPRFGGPVGRLQPYIAEELFWYFDDRDLGNLRSYIGISFRLVGGELGVYYCLHQKSTAGRWHNFHVIGTSLYFEI